MKSRIWQLAGVGLLGLSISLGAMAEVPGEGHGNEGGPGRSLNSRDDVQQTQPARQGYYQDIPGTTVTIVTGKPAAQANGPAATGRGARTATAMAGARGRDIARGKVSTISRTATGKCHTVGRITSTLVAIGTARTAAAISW